MILNSLIVPIIKRNQGIDILRAIALLGVIIAHVSSSNIILQVRSFDVTLMVILSAVSYLSCCNELQKTYLDYCSLRVKRLIIPTWIFITIYFMLFHEKDIIVVFTSYLLIWGIGYVWIIRVFFLVAILAPILHKFNSLFKSRIRFWFGISLMLCVNELVIYKNSDIIANSLIIRTIFVTLPYLLVYMIGLRIYNASKKEICIVSVMFFLLFIIICFLMYLDTGKFVPNYLYKYPPRLYYLSYGLAISFLLYVFRDKIVYIIYKMSSKFGNLMCWVGQHTLWIYFWHIVFISMTICINNSKERLFIVLISAVGCTYLQCLILKIICLYISSPVIKKNIRILFNG